MKKLFIILALSITSLTYAETLPTKYTDLLKYVQPAPDQGEANTCLYMASTGAMELLLNQRDKIKNPKIGGKNDLSESFLIWQKDYADAETTPHHFIEEIVLRFNYEEAVQNKYWPFKAYNKDGTDSLEAWSKHPDFDNLPRMVVPKLKTQLLFARGKKYATDVLLPEDITSIKEALIKHKAPIIINYNDDEYWHVILIVGFDDKKKGECYELETRECNKKGSFYVRDSNGKRFEARDYNWFLTKVNAAAVVELR